MIRTRGIISLMSRIHARPSARSTLWDRTIHVLLFWIDTLQVFQVKASSFRHVAETRIAKRAQGAANRLVCIELLNVQVFLASGGMVLSSTHSSVVFRFFLLHLFILVF